MSGMHQRKLIRKNMMEWLEKMANDLPHFLNIDKEYHLERVKKIYLAPYKSKNRKDRDKKMAHELHLYALAISNLFSTYVELDGDYDAFIQTDYTESEKCVICSSNKIEPIQEKEGENRYFCSECHALHIPGEKSTTIFYSKKQTDDSKSTPSAN